ncbi:hypothetical protein, partial [Mesorhizobium japonicum]|uniref:hypothetical protein n=1 Tax=Mesorhizobium japonicum TaxID=2066070 RepID=UPI003B5A4199
MGGKNLDGVGGGFVLGCGRGLALSRNCRGCALYWLVWGGGIVRRLFFRFPVLTFIYGPRLWV